MNIKKLKIILATTLTGAVLVFLISYLTLPILDISIEPKGSKVFINNSFHSESPYKLRLKKDTYQIKVTNEDFIDYVETINLKQNYKMSIVLKPKKDANVIDTPISHSLTFSLGATQGNSLLSISRDNSHLVKIDDSIITTVHSEPIKTFDYVHPVVALIEKKDPTSIVFINIETNEKKRITPKEVVAMTNLSISPNSNDIFILGNINTIKRTSGLYRISNTGENLVKITDTKATSIKALNDQVIIEFAYADYNDTSTISVLDTFSKKNIFSKHGNSFSVSPNKNSVAVFNSEKIIMFSYKTQSLIEHKVGHSYYAEWLDPEKILVFANGKSGAEFLILNIIKNTKTQFKKVSDLDGIYIKSVDGVTKSHIYLTSSNGTLYNIPRSIVESPSDI